MKTSIKKRLTANTEVKMIPCTVTTCRITSDRMDEVTKSKVLELIENFDQTKEEVKNPRIINNAFFYDSESKNPNIGNIRKIVKVQTNAIQFEGGSWLYFPTAAESKELTNNTFEVFQIIDGVECEQLRYEIITK